MLRVQQGQLLLFASEEQHALMNVEHCVSLRKCREEDRGRAIVQYRKSDTIFYLEIPRYEVVADKDELRLFGNGSQRYICNSPSEKAVKTWLKELGAVGVEVSLPKRIISNEHIEIALLSAPCRIAKSDFGSVALAPNFYPRELVQATVSTLALGC